MHGDWCPVDSIYDYAVKVSLSLFATFSYFVELGEIET